MEAISCPCVSRAAPASARAADPVWDGRGLAPLSSAAARGLHRAAQAGKASWARGVTPLLSVFIFHLTPLLSEPLSIATLFVRGRLVACCACVRLWGPDEQLVVVVVRSSCLPPACPIAFISCRCARYMRKCALALLSPLSSVIFVVRPETCRLREERRPPRGGPFRCCHHQACPLCSLCCGAFPRLHARTPGCFLCRRDIGVPKKASGLSEELYVGCVPAV